MPVKIDGIEKHSPAAGAGISAGELLLSINGNEINDVLDYRFYMVDTLLKLDTLTPSGETKTYHIRKEEYQELGLTFETYLMDKQHSCKNRCIFCFIDQMPKGMRPSLYFKDDDSRMSFLFGNYVTLTNLEDRDIQRIVKLHISPINVSVHTTNPQLRVKMMANPRAGECLKYLDTLAEGGIKINVQLVLCPGVNDGPELERTLSDLEGLIPALESVSCVPVGLTKFREGLFPLRTYTPEEAGQVIDLIHRFSDRFEEQYGSRIAYPSDEFFLKAGRELPGVGYYGDFSQLESGVGMMTLLEDEFTMALGDLEPEAVKPSHVSLATGKAAFPLMEKLACALERKLPQARVSVYAIENHFFGEEITVCGLITGRDLTEQLAGKELGDRLLISAAMLRHEQDLFLDGLSVEAAEKKLGVPICPAASDGFLLARAMAGMAEDQENEIRK